MCQDDPKMHTHTISEQETRKLMSEAVLAKLLIDEISKKEQPRSRTEKALKFLSNGFVLLIFGTIFTSILVPIYKNKQESRTERTILMKQCLYDYLNYSNSIWEEFYLIFPLTLEEKIDKKQYLKKIKEISDVKLKRYNSYAKVKALSLVFREDEGEHVSEIENELNDYAVKVNNISVEIDSWLSDLYCTPVRGKKSPCAKYDVKFEPYKKFSEIQDRVVHLGNETSDILAGEIVKHINGTQK